MLSGDNNILGKAGEAKTRYDESAFKERLQTEVLGNYDVNTELNATTLKKEIERNLENSNVTNSELPLIVKNTKTNTAYLIDTDGTVMLYDEEAVARIKDKFYKTLQLAINAMPTSDSEIEIIIVNDFTESSEVIIDKNIKLNLNGKRVKMLNSINVNADCKLELNGTGILQGETSNLIINNGEVQIDGPELVGVDYCISNHGKTTLISGKIKCITESGRAINSGTAEINGGTIEASRYGFFGANFKMTNGSIISDKIGVAIYSGSTRGKINISGGSIEAGLNNTSDDACDGVVAYSNDDSLNCADITIIGGSISGKRCGVLVNTNSTLIIGDKDVAINSIPSIQGINNIGVSISTNATFSFYNGSIIGNANPPYRNVDNMRPGKTLIPVIESNGAYTAMYTN